MKICRLGGGTRGAHLVLLVVVIVVKLGGSGYRCCRVAILVGDSRGGRVGVLVVISGQLLAMVGLVMSISGLLLVLMLLLLILLLLAMLQVLLLAAC